MKDLNGREITALAPIALLIIVLGVFPAPLLNVINPAVDRVMTTVGVSDPEVTFPILGESVTSEGGSE
jgi:NADH-quinone oxidoreductase subunit M